MEPCVFDVIHVLANVSDARMFDFWALTVGDSEAVGASSRSRNGAAKGSAIDPGRKAGPSRPGRRPGKR